MRLTIIVSALVIFASCSEIKKENTSNYFDSKKYFSIEKKRLAANNSAVEKYLSFNEEKDHKIIENADWDKELKEFALVDLNKPAYFGTFEYSCIKEGGLELRRYKSTDKNNDLELAEIWFLENQPRKLHFELRINNNLFDLTKSLWYYADSLYTIDMLQTVRLMNPKSSSIKGFIKGKNPR